MLVVDASVALKFITQEPGSDAAMALLAAPDALIAPDWLLAECASGLAKKVLANGLSKSDADASFAALRQFFSELHSTIELLDSSLDLSIQLDHALYDCLYLALALREEATMITADMRFAKAARRGGFAARVRLLGEQGDRNE